MCMGPAALQGLPLYLICMEAWNESHKQEVDGMFSSVVSSLVLTELLNYSKCCPFLFAALPLSVLNNHKKRDQGHL